jgi:hypothetical protein
MSMIFRLWIPRLCAYEKLVFGASKIILKNVIFNIGYSIEKNLYALNVTLFGGLKFVLQPLGQC